MPPPVVPTSMPESISAGDNIYFKFTDKNYKASIYGAFIILIKGDAQYVVTASASGDDFIFQVLSAASVLYDPGTYKWNLFFTFTTTTGTAPNIVTIVERYPSEYSGIMAVLPNIATATTGVETRSIAQIKVEAFETYFRGEKSLDWLSKSLGDMHVTRQSPTEIDKRYNYWLTIYKGEQAAALVNNGKSTQNTLLVRFVK